MTGVGKGQVPVFWARAEGANVEDVDGNVFIDCTSAFGVAAVGHRDELVVSAIKRQAERLVHGMGDVFPHEPRVQVSKDIVRTVGRHRDSRVILVNTGSEAIEVAIKTVVLHTRKPGIVSFYGGFHGQSMGALSVSSQRDLRDPFIAQIATGTTFVPFPNPYRPPFGMSSSNVATACLDHVDAVLSGRVSGAPPIGGVVVEPIQGLNGCIVPPDDYLVGLRRLCDDHGVLMIADEIFTGYGRSRPRGGRGPGEREPGEKLPPGSQGEGGRRGCPDWVHRQRRSGVRPVGPSFRRGPLVSTFRSFRQSRSLRPPWRRPALYGSHRGGWGAQGVAAPSHARGDRRAVVPGVNDEVHIRS